MRIAIVTTSYPAHEGDPAGHFVEADARALARQGHTVTVLAPLASPRAGREAAGVSVVAIPGGAAFGWPGVAARVRAAPWRAIGAASWVLAAGRALVHLEADRVMAHWSVPCAWPIVTSLGAKQSARPELHVVSHGGDVRLLAQMPTNVRRAVVARLVARATTWRFVSAALHDELARTLEPALRDALARIAHVAPSAFELPRDIRMRAAERRAGLILSGRKAYVVVGRLIIDKRVDRVVTHLARMPRAPDDRDRPLLVVVGDGPERGRLEQHARAAQVDARFVGKVDRTEALTWMAAADALLFASRREGCPTVIREADALGVRVEIVG